MRGLNGKRVIVTGGASGIGREVCKRFAEEGRDVAVFEVNAAGAAETTKLIKNAGGKANSIRAYIADSAAVDAAAAELESVGRLMFLINNAGWDEIRPLLESGVDLWSKVIDINLYGPLHMRHAVLPGMVKEREQTRGQYQFRCRACRLIGRSSLFGLQG
jgi:2-hydroxycyclohexanecarboxyl-CoA dehydrogenase